MISSGDNKRNQTCFLCLEEKTQWEKVVWKAIVDKTGQDYFYDLVFKITNPDVILSSEMQIHRLRIYIDLARFLLVGREFFWAVENFWPVENIFCRSRIFWAVENFFVGREFSGQSRIVFAGREFFWVVSRELFSQL